jgi:hypothetical protein
MSSTLSRETLVETFLSLGKALVEVPEGERSWLEGEVAGLVVHFTKDFLEIVATAESGPELKLSMWLDDLALHPAESPLRRELGDFLTKLAEVPRALDAGSAARRVNVGAKDARPDVDFASSGMSSEGEDRSLPA